MEAGLELERSIEGTVRTPGSRVRLARVDDRVAFAFDEAEAVWLDFRRKEARRYRLAERTVCRERLHARVDFGGAEALNRLVFTDVLRAGKATQPETADFEQVMVETQLGVRAPGRPPTTLGAWRRSRLGAFFRGPPPDIRADPADGGTRFEALGQELGWCSDQGRASAHLPAYLHFLRREHAVHPLLVDWLQARGTVPAEARFGNGSLIQPARVTLRLGSPVEAVPGEPAGFEPVTGLDGTEPVDALLARPPPVAPLPVWARLGESRTLLAGPDPLGGMLTFMELALELPQELPPELAALSRGTADPRLQRLGALFGAPPTTEAQHRKRAADFAELRAGQPARAHVLGTFEAASRVAVGEAGQAKALLEAALALNPRLTGAWVDLGHLYRSAWEMPRAWACFGRARELAADHPLVRNLATFEQSIEAAHPEHFHLAFTPS